MDAMLARLATFALLPLSVAVGVSSPRLARLGFYFCSAAQTVVCFRCRQAFSVDHQLPQLESHARLCSSSAEADKITEPALHDEPYGGRQNPPPDVTISSDCPTSHREDAVTSGSNRPRHETLHTSTSTNASREYTGVLSEVRNPSSTQRHQPDFERLKDESVRLATFHDWPERAARIVEPRDLAKAGMFYTGQSDRVQCAFCRGCLHNWVQWKTPADEHRKQFPDCSFIQPLEDDDIPAAAAASSPGRRHHQQTSGSKLSSDKSRNELQQSSQPMSLNSQAIEPAVSRHVGYLNSSQSSSLLIPRHVEFASESARMKSFERGRVGQGQTAQALSSAGFFYVGPEDNVRCFQCGGGLKSWKPTDDPCAEHQRWFPDCPFMSGKESRDGEPVVNARVNNEPCGCSAAAAAADGDATGSAAATAEATGQKRRRRKTRAARLRQSCVNAAVTAAACTTDDTVAHCSISSRSNPTAAVSIVTSTATHSPLSAGSSQPTAGDDELLLLAENRRLKELHVCRVCMDLQIDTVFLPCGHFVCCNTCSRQLRTCPICRSLIRGTVRVRATE